jgi:hypothetical protein
MPGEHVKVILGPTLRDWPGTLRYALENAAAAYKRELARYPSQAPGSSYRRTHTLGKTAHGEVQDLSMKLIAVEYARYPLWGTGLYGPKHEMIVPKTKKVLAWPVSRGRGGHVIKSGAGHTGSAWTAAHLGERWMFAMESRGYIWPGKLDALRKAIGVGFAAGLRKAIAEGRRL